MSKPRTWLVFFGESVRVYYTEYHADQFCRALFLNGTEFRRVNP